MIDLSAIDVEDLVVKLDLSNAKITNSGEEINFSCFGAEHSHGDESPSAYINIETTAWFCHGCKRRGNAITLVMDAHNVPRAMAERELRDWYGIEFDEPIGGSMIAETEARFREVTPAPEPPKPPRSWLMRVRFDWAGGEVREDAHNYLLGRGFSPGILAEWDIGYDFLSDRLTIPVFDVDGKLVGIKARDWTDTRQPKYLILGDRPAQTSYGFAPYETAKVIFGLHRERHVRRVVLFEGELNAIAASQVGVPRPVASGMSYLSSRQVELLVREVDEVVLFYDHGKAGHEGVWGRRDTSGRWKPGAVQALEPHVTVRIVDPLPEDPAKLLELGRGSEIVDLIEAAETSLAKRLLFV